MEVGTNRRTGHHQGRFRSIASISLAVLGAVLAVVGAVLLYARTEIVDEGAFADHAAAALENDAVSHLLATEITVQIAEKGSADLVAGRPLIQSVVDTVIGSKPFGQIFRQAAVQANRVLFVRDRNNVALQLADAMEVVRFGLQSVSPKLADELPRSIDLTLLKLKKRAFARQSLAIADQVRWLGIVAPLLALIAFVASVALAPDRRVGVLRAAIAVAAAGIVLAITLLIVRARILAGVFGSDEVTDADVRGAIGGVLDAFFGGLFAWALGLALLGLIVGGASAVLDPERAEDPVTKLRRRITERPRTTAGRALRAVLAIGAGLLVALDTTFALQVFGLLAGAYLIYFGSGELLLLLQPPTAPGEEHKQVRTRALQRTAIAAGVTVAVVAIAVVVFTGSAGNPNKALATPADGCNGSRALCKLRLSDVVFAGTHNSFSAADSPNWFIANQRRTISRQLEDGVRLLLLDPHWGIADAKGRVRTDFEAEGRDRNRVAKAMPPATLAAAERLAGSFGVRANTGGEPDVFLCHTACELGATKMVDALTDIREFLDRNRDEVVILFIEPYVPPSAIRDTFERSGIEHYAAVLDRGLPLPTLGELVSSDHRLVVFTERDADGTVPWYLDGFSFVQDTPLGATTPDELSCKLNRGTRDSPMLMLNQWADVFPPRASANPGFQTKQAIIGRAHECARKRGLPVNLIAVDYYDQGDLIDSVAKLNRERIRAARGKNR